MINVNLLPKNLRRVREPGYWRVLAILFPLLVTGVVVALQISAMQTVRNLDQEKLLKENRLATLQPFLREQRELVRRQQQLGELIAVKRSVEENRIVWTDEINAMLEMLPARGDGARPNIDFRSLAMTAIDPPRSDPDRYEGIPAVAEITVSGFVKDTNTLAEFIRSLEQSTEFGVNFQSVNRQTDTGIYQYSLMIGSLLGDGNEAR